MKSSRTSGTRKAAPRPPLSAVPTDNASPDRAHELLLDIQTEPLKKLLLGMVPENGDPIHNQILRPTFIAKANETLGLQISEDTYWEIRDQLVDDNKLVFSVAPGGAVKRNFGELPVLSAAEPAIAIPPERILYDPFFRYVQQRYTKDYGLRYFVAQKTADQGGRSTGGKWTRPDWVCLAVRVYQFAAGRVLEVVTFEIKPSDEIDVSGVFEAAAHSTFAHKSYLAVHAPYSASIDPHVKRQCERFGIGLIRFTDPNDLGSFEVLIEPNHRRPNPEDVDEFIGSQFSAENQKVIREILR